MSGLNLTPGLWMVTVVELREVPRFARGETPEEAMRNAVRDAGGNKAIEALDCRPLTVEESAEFMALYGKDE